MDKPAFIIVVCRVDDKDTEDSVVEYTALLGYSGQSYYISPVNESELIEGFTIDSLRTELLKYLRRRHPVLNMRVHPRDPERAHEIRELINRLRLQS